MVKLFIGIEIKSHFKIVSQTEDVKRYNQITGEPYNAQIKHTKAFIGNEEIPKELFDGEVSWQNLMLGDDEKTECFAGLSFDVSSFGTLAGALIKDDEDDYEMSISVDLFNETLARVKEQLASLNITDEPKIYVYPS